MCEVCDFHPERPGWLTEVAGETRRDYTLAVSAYDGNHDVKPARLIQNNTAFVQQIIPQSFGYAALLLHSESP